MDEQVVRPGELRRVSFLNFYEVADFVQLK